MIQIEKTELIAKLSNNQSNSLLKHIIIYETPRGDILQSSTTFSTSNDACWSKYLDIKKDNLSIVIFDHLKKYFNKAMFEDPESETVYYVYESKDYYALQFYTNHLLIKEKTEKSKFSFFIEINKMNKHIANNAEIAGLVAKLREADGSEMIFLFGDYKLELPKMYKVGCRKIG